MNLFHIQPLIIFIYLLKDRNIFKFFFYIILLKKVQKMEDEEFDDGFLDDEDDPLSEFPFEEE